MSLVVSDRATEKQIAILKNLGYLGKLNLSMTEAAELIDELFEEKQMEELDQYYMGVDMWGN